VRSHTRRKIAGIEKAVGPFFEAAELYSDTTREKFALSLRSELGPCANTVKRVFSETSWDEMRHAWLTGRLRQHMDEVYRDSILRSDFNIPRITNRVKVGYPLFSQLLGEEWQRLAGTLPRAQDRMLSKLREMVDANVPVSQLL